MEMKTRREREEERKKEGKKSFISSSWVSKDL